MKKKGIRYCLKCDKPVGLDFHGLIKYGDKIELKETPDGVHCIKCYKKLKGVTMKRKLKDETFRGYKIKFYYDDNRVIAQPIGFASPLGLGRTKSEAFNDIKPKIK